MRRLLPILPLLLLLACPSLRAETPSPTAAAFFEKEIRPLLAEHCQKCHGDEKDRGGLRLTSRELLLKGGDSGPAAVPGQPDRSLLIRAIRHNGDLKMPPKEKERLSERQITLLTQWVKIGLPWPDSGKTVARGSKFSITPEQRRFWSFQPVARPVAPAVKDAAWTRSALDRFILARLEAKGLRPARAADKRTLLRRATFDLTGLPPTPEEIDAFLKDTTPDAFARVVDRLLSSPHYGERWGRHWLDLVRYTDSFDARGLGGEMDCADAWRYRDWVVEAFNRDLPYDRFVTDQVAGDLVPVKGGLNRDGIVATGMLALGNWGGGDADKEKLLTDIADDQVDVVSRTFLGLTVACARCHDHKFDPISAADYYGLAGIFFSTHILPNVGPKTNGPPMMRIPLLAPAELAERRSGAGRVAKAEAQRKAEAERFAGALARSLHGQTTRYLLAAWDYQHRPTNQLRLSADDFARRQGLLPFALRRWLDLLGGGDYRLMTKSIRDVLGKAGVHGWRGDPDCPSMLANTTSDSVKMLTFTLPPRSVSVHPGPTNGVVVAWRSPVSGRVRVSGQVVDADPAGGDGIAWVIDHRRASGLTELAAGDFPNGGRQRFDQGRGAVRLKQVQIEAGDRIELLVLPKATHVCDTTVVELRIALADGAKVWDLSRDVLADMGRGGKSNPHADCFGNAGVWHFLDMADSRRANRPAALAASLGAWDRSAATTDRAALERAARAVEKGLPVDDPASPFRIRRREDEGNLPAESRAALAKLDAEIAGQRKALVDSIPFANGAQEGGVPGSPHAGVHDVRIHIRGRYDRLGGLVPRRFPEILGGLDEKPIAAGSGRLQLARWLTRVGNPLTARVMVNRIWQHHFGAGLVRTPSNFGKLGEPPTHPELLDWLARQFVKSGWSVKQMHRLIMLSATYRQASEPVAETLKQDPDNRLFGRMSRRRLEAEAVRDSLLAVAGRLDRKQGGPAVRAFRSPRRTVYLMTVRSDRSGFGPLFDTADPTVEVDRRTISTVAPQALFLLNHPFALEQRRELAKRIRAVKGDDGEKISRAYVLLYGRPPSDEEKKIGLDFLKGAGATVQAWEEYCQVLLCANEFIYVD